MLQLDAAFATVGPGTAAPSPLSRSQFRPVAHWHRLAPPSLPAQGGARHFAVTAASASSQLPEAADYSALASSSTSSSSGGGGSSSSSSISNAGRTAVLLSALALGAARARRRHRHCRGGSAGVIRWAAKAPAAPPLSQEERQQQAQGSEGSGRGKNRLKRRLEGGDARDGRGADNGGTFKSPWTGKVYDRFAPIGLAPKGEEAYRTSGLGVARAYETPLQKKIKETDSGQRPIEEWEKFYPGIEPERLKPEAEMTKPRQPKKERPPNRHAYRAGNFADMFKQVVLNTVVQLKLEKKKPVWYVETCTGEGEYHVNRLRPVGQKPNMAWPTAEHLYDALKDQDLTYLPPELREWMEAVTALNEGGDFEVKKAGSQQDVDDDDVDDAADEGASIQWLPSSTYMALRQLRTEDPVTLFEDTHVCFAALFNFVRNWSDTLKPHIELSFQDGFKEVKNLFVKRYYESKAHGKFKGGRGLVFVDSQWDRGSERYSCQVIINSLRKSWRAATVMVSYQLGPNSEPKARKFIHDVLEKAEVPLELLMVEMYVDNKDWHEESEQPKWRGAGMLISSPPGTTAERAKAALEVMAQELSKLPDSHRMRVRVESLS